MCNLRISAQFHSLAKRAHLIEIRVTVHERGLESSSGAKLCYRDKRMSIRNGAVDGIRLMVIYLFISIQKLVELITQEN